MVKYIICPGCKQEHPIKGGAKTRADLQMNKGDQFPFNCVHCGKMANTHVNDVKSKVDKRVIVAAMAVAVIAGVLVFYYFSVVIGLAMFLIPMAVWRQQETAVSAFNRYKIKR